METKVNIEHYLKVLERKFNAGTLTFPTNLLTPMRYRKDVDLSFLKEGDVILYKSKYIFSVMKRDTWADRKDVLGIEVDYNFIPLFLIKSCRGIGKQIAPSFIQIAWTKEQKELSKVC